MKTVRHYSKDGQVLHIETEGCIVNVRVGLHDRHGNRVTSVQVAPDEYPGAEWTLDGQSSTRVIEGQHPVYQRHRDAIRQAALAFLHGDDDQGISLKDLADALDVPYEDVEAIQRQDAEAESAAQWADVEAGEQHLRDTDPDRSEPSTWRVAYQIRSLIEPAPGALISENTIEVSATSDTAARRAATEWVYDNDPHYDDRIQPVLKILTVDAEPVGFGEGE